MTIPELYHEFVLANYRNVRFNNHFTTIATSSGYGTSYREWPEWLKERYIEDYFEVKRELKKIKRLLADELKGKVYKINDEEYVTSFNGEIVNLKLVKDDTNFNV